MVSFLPPAWINEQWLTFGCHLLSGGTVNFAENAETQPEDVREIAPSLVVYSSRLWESQAGQVRAKMQGASWLKRADQPDVHAGGHRRWPALREAGAEARACRCRLLDVLGDLLVFRKVRDSLGLHAGPGLLLLRLHAVARTSSVSSTPRACRSRTSTAPLRPGRSPGSAGGVQTRGTVGSVNPGVEVKLGDRGEIMVRHPGTFLGYHNDPEADRPRAARRLGLHRATAARSKDGDLVFVDRLEDLITHALRRRGRPSGDREPAQVQPLHPGRVGLRRARPATTSRPSSSSTRPTPGAGPTSGRSTTRPSATSSQKPEVYGLIEEEIAQVNQTLPEDRRIEPVRQSAQGVRPRRVGAHPQPQAAPARCSSRGMRIWSPALAGDGDERRGRGGVHLSGRPHRQDRRPL